MVRTGKGSVVTSEHGSRLLILNAACGTMEQAIGPDAQTYRPGDAWPVSALRGCLGSPAALVQFSVFRCQYYRKLITVNCFDSWSEYKIQSHRGSSRVISTAQL